MPDQSNPTDRVFRALASQPRRQILAMLARGEGSDCCSEEGVCACDFAERLGLGAPTISHHMKILIEAGLVESEKRGLWVYYRVIPEGFAAAVAEMGELLGGESKKGGCC